MKIGFLLRSLMIMLSLTAQAVYARHHLVDLMERAVAQGDLVALKKYVRQLDRENISLAERNKALSELIVSCQEIAQEQEDKSLLFNKWDITRFVGGAALTLGGAYFLIKEGYRLWTEGLYQCEVCKIYNCDGTHRCDDCKKNNMYDCNDRFRHIRHDSWGRQFFVNTPNGLRAGEKPRLYAKVLGSTGVVVAGLYHFYKGLVHAGQNEVIADARILEEYLKEMINPVKK